MKKLYFLAAVLSIGFIYKGQAQYTATNSGNWSSPITWAPGAIPAMLCNNCSVTINAGIIVQVDAHTELSGTSILTLRDGAQLIVGNSSQSSITSAFNIVMDTLPGNSMINFVTANSKIIATAAGTYDGIFVGPFPNSIYQKVIGNAPSLFQGNNIIGTALPSYGTSLAGPHVLFSGGTLPLLMTNFNATLTDNVVKVTWSTEQESNLNQFVMLRSGDGVTWETIGKIQAKGNSSIPVNYSFTDQTPLQGINYYRVKAVDNNLQYKFSEIKLIKGLFIKGIKFGPNPVRDNLHITFGSDISSALTLRLINQYGQVLQQKQISQPAGSTILFSLNNYAQGIYTLHVKAADGSQNSYRIVLNH
ncbi:MAG TPA: T9SS type A sorting domain-containing protein [Puia sp.]|nr:T9SS type A sorting domain-containing protein [Puia sp.]